MAENAEGSGSNELSFKVKTSGDGLHNITISDSATVLDLKTKLSGAEYENVAVDRMRLIYSGRVMKNEEPLSTYKIKNGNTIHMVKSAASNPSPTNTSSSSAPAQPAVPSNMSAGTSASNPLDNLTGARYAGFTNLPSADMFGPNGGMGPPPSADDIADIFSNPQAAQAMNEAMSNPAFIDMMIQNNPFLRNMPNAREVLQSQLPVIRQMMQDPDALRSMLRMRSALEGSGLGGAGGFPAPGNVNNPGTQPSQGGQPPNPLSAIFGANPFLNPFGAQPPPYARSPPAAGAGATTGTAQSTSTGDNTSPTNQSSGTGAPGTGPAPSPGADGAASQLPGGNPFAALFPPQGGAGFGGFPSMSPQQMEQMLRGMGLGGAPAPADNRPPEERYAEQLRQLNDMGFTDFDRNVTALRRSGGSVQGAIEHLLNG